MGFAVSAAPVPLLARSTHTCCGICVLMQNAICTRGCFAWLVCACCGSVSALFLGDPSETALPPQVRAAASSGRRMSSLLRRNARAVLARANGAALLRSRTASPAVVRQQQRSLSAGRYVEQMRAAWVRDPSSVHESWDSYFSKEPEPTGGSGSGVATVTAELQEVASDHIKMLLLVRSYQARGHYMCKLDPLGINDANLHVDKFAYRGGQEQADSVPKFLSYKTYGFTEKDLDREFYLNANVGGGQGGLVGSGQQLKLREIIAIMEEAYCGTVGVEFTHIADLDQVSPLPGPRPLTLKPTP
jgi:hypothetical protein